MKPAEFERLWSAIESLLPKDRPKHKGGRPRVSDKQALRGILFILETGIPLGKTPQGDGLRLGHDLLAEAQAVAGARSLGQAPWGLARNAQCLGMLRLAALLNRFKRGAFPPGGQETGPNPTDRGKRGTKRHIVVNGHGVPLVCLLSGAHRHDCKLFASALDALPRIKGKRGRPRKRPRKVHADKGYDYPMCRHYLQRRGIVSRIARRCVESSERLGRYRWIVERSLSWLNRFRKLRIRYERCSDAYLALCKFACCLITLRFVDRFC